MDDTELVYKPNALIHLYETAHSGFYGEEPTTTVNLVPKTWTRYTVTDGDWMTPKTVEPLVLRDIYLANKIDELDEYKKNLYKAGKHIIIDYDTNTISVNPFEYKYEFTNGILNNDYDVYSDIPSYYGGLKNQLCIKDNSLSYNCTALTPEQQNPPTVVINSATEVFNFSATINGEPIETLYDEYMDNVGLIAVFKNQYQYDDNYHGNEGYILSANCWSADVGQRFVGILDQQNTEINIDDDGLSSNIFEPTDRTPTQNIEGDFKAGHNFISGDIDMAPENVLYIW